MTALPFNPLPNDKILDMSKFKGFADDTLMLGQIVRIENIVGKGENAGYRIFSFSHNVFKRLLP